MQSDLATMVSTSSGTATFTHVSVVTDPSHHRTADQKIFVPDELDQGLGCGPSR
jgi:hypothetical protein